MVLVVWVKICVFTQVLLWDSEWQERTLRLKLFPVTASSGVVVLQGH